MTSRTDNPPADLTLVVPVLNDGNLVIPSIATLKLTLSTPFEVLFIHEDDQDPTLPAIQTLQEHFDGIRLIRNSGRRGVIPSIKTGLASVRTPFVGIWIAYHVDPHGVIDRMMAVARDGYDLVSASRFKAEGFVARGSVLKRLLSFAGNLFLHRIVGMPISDITTSLKIYRVSALDQISTQTTVDGGWAFNAELSIKMAIAGFRLAEVPLERKNLNLMYGVSHFRVLGYLPEYLSWLVHGIRNRQRIRNSRSLHQ